MEYNSFDKLYNLHLEHKLAHAYLIETNNVELCSNNLIEITKKIFCEKEYSNTCKECNICNLINNKTLPNLIIVEPIKKSIKKGQIDDLKQKCSSIPLFVKKNIYIIKYAEKMNEVSYNKLLRFLEEPEENIIGFYITNNKDCIPSTILSRLEIIKDYYNMPLDQLLSEEQIIQADLYIEKLNNNDKDLVLFNSNVLCSLLKERVDLINFFKYLFEKYNSANKCTKNDKNYKIIKLLTKYLEELNYNVNTKLLLNSFAIEMSDING